MALNFPSSPTIGDTFTNGDVVWTYTSQGWIGRTAIPLTAWGDISAIPTLVSDFGALSDPGQDSYLKWNDTTNEIEWVAIPDASNITVQGGGQNLNLWDMAGQPAGITVVTLEIAAGAVITSLSPSAPALDLRGFASGSTINIVNHGHILGHGGKGGDGGLLNRIGTTEFAVRPQAGEDGGPAIMGPGSGITVTIDNTDGYVWGGGGGGGGGGGSTTDGAVGVGGGGGGGAGFGGRGMGIGYYTLADGGASNGIQATNGTAGTRVTTGANGTGGTGTDVQTSAVGGDGGDGGDWGAAGTAGDSPTTYSSDVPGGAGGAAGLAVNQNGGTVSFSAGSSSPNVKGSVT